MHTAVRMIDANANRAREGLRVLEDAARFVLDDATLSGACKHARHDLQRAISALPITDSDLLGARDTASDVGTSISTDSERVRAHGLTSVVTAASKRAAEALRAIEEAAKTIGSDGRAFETIRYRVYELEKQIGLRLLPSCPQWTLCVLVTRELCRHHTPDEIIKLASAGGADCIQIREKSMSDAEMLDYAGALVDVCRAVGVDVIVNDRVAIARLIQADGVHLGQDDLPTQAARGILGHGRWIGRTCPSVDSAIEAIEHGADSCGLGPMFASATKPKPALAGVDLLSAYLADPRTERTPHLAISGITSSNAPELAALGCRGIAVCGAVIGDPDPRSVCESLVSAIRSPTLQS